MPSPNLCGHQAGLWWGTITNAGNTISYKNQIFKNTYEKKKGQNHNILNLHCILDFGYVIVWIKYFNGLGLSAHKL